MGCSGMWKIQEVQVLSQPGTSLEDNYEPANLSQPSLPHNTKNGMKGKKYVCSLELTVIATNI